MDNTDDKNLKLIYKNTCDKYKNKTPVFLFCVFRDEELLLDYFIKHYKKLGVTHFVMIDNLSQDFGVNYLKSLKDINMTIYEASGSFKESVFGSKWVNYLLNKYYKNQYCFVVDVDELFYLDTDMFENIYDLIDDMEKNKNNVVKAFLLDMYPKKIDNSYEKGESFLKYSKFFDQYNTRYYREYSGGVRERIFGITVCLQKIPFFKFDFFPIELGGGWHDLKLDGKEIEYTKDVSIYDGVCTLLHFKFLKPSLKEFFDKRYKRNQDWNNSAEYKAYSEFFSNNSNLIFYNKDYSTQFIGIDSLKYFHKLRELNKVTKQSTNLLIKQKNMPNKKSKISIIIPVYNTEKYLAQCLESVVNQTLKEIEIIIVNDGSTDGSMDIIEKYRKKDKRIRVISHDKNLGLLQARRTGVLEACGEYVQHVDSDDWLESDTCEVIYKALKNSNCDLCHFGAILWNEDSVYKSKSEYWNVFNKVKSNTEILDRMFDNTISHSIWALVVKRELSLKFYKNVGDLIHLTFMEDTLASFFFLSSAECCLCLSYRGYNYRLNIGTGSQGSQDAEKFAKTFRDAVVVINEVKKNLKNAGIYNKYKKQFKYKRDVYFVHARYTDWVNLKEQEKYKAIVLLKDYELLNYLIEILFFHKQFEDIKYFSEIKFEDNLQGQKRIAFYINRIHNGGREKVVQLLANELSRRGWFVVVITLEDKNDNDYKLEKNIKRIVLPKDKSKILFFINNKLKEFSINLLSNHNWLSEEELLMMMYLRLSGINVSFSDHNTLRINLFKQNNKEFINRVLMGTNLINVVTCLSKIDAVVWRYFGHDAVYISNPIELPEKTNITKNKNQIIWVGRLEKTLKQPDHAIRAFSVVYKHNKNAKLIIVGGEDDGLLGKYYNELKKMCIQLKCAENVKFIGFSDRVFDFLQESSVHWLTSSLEGFPMVWIEAKSVGIPTILYKMPWIELNGKGSVSVEQGDYNSVAIETLKIFENEKLLNDISNDAKDDLSQRFDPIRIFDRWEAFYLDLTKTGKSKFCNEKDNESEMTGKEYFISCLKRIIEINDCKESDNKNLQRLKKSKSFKMGDLFFRSIKRPYKLITFPYNFIKILFGNK